MLLDLKAIIVGIKAANNMPLDLKAINMQSEVEAAIMLLMLHFVCNWLGD